MAEGGAGGAEAPKEAGAGSGAAVSYELPADGELPRTYRVTLAIVDANNPDWIISTFCGGRAAHGDEREQGAIHGNVERVGRQFHARAAGNVRGEGDLHAGDAVAGRWRIPLHHAAVRDRDIALDADARAVEQAGAVVRRPGRRGRGSRMSMSGRTALLFFTTSTWRSFPITRRST